MNKISDCIINKKSSLNPVWFMRQAGRYLPEFRKIREKNPNFIKLCLNTRLATEITIQPISRFDLDAAIIFSDILMIPHGLGQTVEFKKGIGPTLKEFDLNNIINSDEKNFVEKMQPVYNSISEVKKIIKNKSCIGFVGAPWTLLVYMLNKKSPKKNFNFTNIVKDKILVKKLIKKLEDTICLHIDKQIEAGADVIQIFDSWAGLIPSTHIDEYCFRPTLNIITHIKKTQIPAICFPRGIKNHYSNFCQTVNPHCISIDYEIDPRWAKEMFNGIPIQGGLDPQILLKDKETIKEKVINLVDIFSDYPYIFNLGHGVLPETKPETIEYVTNLVKGR
jgi:uroporphyrinogen decarboxylase